MTFHDNAGHDHAGHDHAGHDHAGHDHAGHDHAGHDHAGRDAGMTLTELVVSVALLGIITTVLAAAISVVFRSEVGISATVAESHDVQQAVNYFHFDVQSGPFDVAAYQGSAAVDAGTGCDDAGDGNVFRYDATDRRIAYRVTTTGDLASLDRYSCSWNGSTWVQDEVLNIADTLDASGGEPVTVAVVDLNGDDEVDQVVMDFSQSNGDESIIASPRAETGVQAAASGACADDPLAAALDFAGFVHGDVTLHGQNVLGTLAVGGTLRWTPALGVAQNDKNQNYGGVSLYVNQVDWSYVGTDSLNVNGGDVAIGDPYHVFTSGPKKGRIYATNAGTGKFIDVKKDVVPLASVGVIDFGGQFGELQACSNLLAELPGSCTGANCAFHVTPKDGNTNCTSAQPAYPGSGKMCLNLGPQGAQILNIKESELAQITEFSHNGGLSQAHPLIINVIDDDADLHIDFTLSTSSWQNIGNTKNVLINFPTATSVTIDQPLFGTVLAPYAHVTTTGNVQGGVVADSWTHESGTVNNDGNNVFDGTIDWS